MTDSTNLEEYRPRVLLVDDEANIRNLLYTLLESEGYEVLVASNGADGFEIFRRSSRPIELLVTDYNMPDMSGLELARKCALANGRLSVLYLSGAHPDEQLSEELRARKRAFLAKPFFSEELSRKARVLLRGSDARIALMRGRSPRAI